MSYNKTIFVQLTCGLCLLFTLFASSCKKDTTIIPDALNSFKGTVAGTEFIAELSSATENDGLFSISGNINTDANFILYFKGANTVEHPVTTTGTFVDIVDLINDINNEIEDQVNDLGSNFNIDSALVSLNELFVAQADSISENLSAAVIPENECFLFYVINSAIYYTKSGSINLISIDTDLNRISGDFDLELKNLPNGIKFLDGTFEDVEFTKQ